MKLFILLTGLLLMAVSTVGGCGKPFTVDASIRVQAEAEVSVEVPDGA